MKYLATLLLSFCFICFIVTSLSISQSAPKPTTNDRRVKQELELTTRLDEKQYCCVNQLILVVRLIYRNVGTEKTILARGKVIYKDYVSRSLEFIKGGKYESTGINMWSSDISLTASASPDSSYFVILAPGETYETETFIAGPFTVRNGLAGAEDKNGLPTGDYFLQVATITFPFGTSDEEINELRGRWKTYGYLWTANLTSLPMSFTVDNQEAHSKGT